MRSFRDSRHEYTSLAAGAFMLPAAALLVASTGLVPFQYAFAVAMGVVLFIGIPLLIRYSKYGGPMIVGAIAGLAGTLAYDGFRAVLAWVDLISEPFRTIPIYGRLITGETGAPSVLVGWLFHFWNGIVFGIFFRLAVTKPTYLKGIAWGLILELALVVTSSKLLFLTLTDEFLTVSGLGHIAYGVALVSALRILARKEVRWRH